MNMVFLCGEIFKEPEFSHEAHGIKYYKVDMAVMRLSGVLDVLRVLISADKLCVHNIKPGDIVEIYGQMRSFNNKSGIGSRLIISVLAQKIEKTSGENQNRVELTGTLCKTPIYRKTPLGREICDLLLAVGRTYGRTDYLPVICWGKIARECSYMSIGEKISIEGRFQSRTYIKQGDNEERVAYEISAYSVNNTNDEPE